MESFIKKYPFFNTNNIVKNAVTYNLVNKRDAFILVDSVTGEPYRPDVYSEATMLKLLEKENPTDPYTRRPIVAKRGVEGAVMPKRAPKALRLLMEAKLKKSNKPKPLSKKTKRISRKPGKKGVKVTIYRAEGRGSFRHGCRINNDPFVTPWHKVKRMILVMVANDIETKLMGKFHGIFAYRDFTKQDLIEDIKDTFKYILTKKAPVVPIFDEKGVYTQHFYRKMFEKSHKSMMVDSSYDLKEKTLKSIEKALESPRSKTVGSPLPIPSSTGN